ncbi:MULTISPECIES: dUTPase [unclassified Campylobacter]|uniref:dUTPase n=1 Tax=unclassified Campylobacter TaxID=2593542 RepID=UPI0022E9A0D3|nr:MULTISPECIES: dUTP diphosphatase [unclassified Campylobacter]MDA3055153.1 dUTP diphosphatase [Campylobacter sp. VBCF_07 NA4]MDA3061405.1 dUTP diphosphatase [Campylobacter sp. VBCF_02 NA5]MDA3070922.1 dUTP diphosphatase [Campylobacter sp. VBCF_08 NA3]WBR54063.1 dUTP diphosphatase [Campylobacter sp. VBCF_01 NA2]
MENYKKIKEMFLMQQRLNDETNGVSWEDGYTKNGKLINWKRCIYMECAELIDSFAWKHWKNIAAAPDIDNIVIEIVDIWHFVMSYVLEQNKNLKSIDEIASEVISVSAFREFSAHRANIEDYSIYEIVNDIELLIHETSGFNFSVGSLLQDYFRVAIKCGVNLEVLFAKYIGKNVLNKFRQDNGYKEGSYRKIWNGKEDNVVLVEILNSGVLEVGEIYANLEKAYKNSEI